MEGKSIRNHCKFGLMVPICLLLLQSYAVSSQLPCIWSQGPGKLVPSIQGYVKGVYTVNHQTCKDECMNQTAFICAAINYDNGICELLAESNQTASVEQETGWMYFLRPICAGIWLPWTAEKVKSLKGTFQSSTNRSLQHCMENCLRVASNDSECTAINVHLNSTEGNCRYQTLRPGDSSSTRIDGTEWQYFIRPTWYLDASTARTEAELKKLSTVGNLPHLFTGNQLPASGYLVAWQYYLNSYRPCSTDVAIWRPVAMELHRYKLISRTTLTPEENSTDGVRFQFVQNQSIRVRKGDIISVLGRQDNCGEHTNSMVSVDGKNGKNRTLTIINPQIDYVIGQEFDTNSSLLRLAIPALRAYVSEYLSLSEAPIAHHNESLSDGQVFLRLAPLLTTEDSVVVAGYRIICSTDAQMTQTVPCYNNLVPVTTEVVLLSLPNTTRTYHAAVQIARNFNGIEQLEDKLSNISLEFCPGRAQSTSAYIIESILRDKNHSVEVNVTLLHQFKGDSCAQEIKLNCSNYSGSYKKVEEEQNVLFLQLKQGLKYNLTVYLKLKGGAEIIFWSKPYTAPLYEHTSVAEHEQAGKAGLPTNAPINLLTVVLGVLAGIFFLYSIAITTVFVRRGCLSRGAQKHSQPDHQSSTLTKELNSSNHTYEETVLSAPHVYNSLEQMGVGAKAGKKKSGPMKPNTAAGSSTNNVYGNLTFEDFYMNSC